MSEQNDTSPIARTAAESLREMLVRASGAGSQTGATVEAMLFDRGTPVAALRALKDDSKALAGARGLEADRAAATAVYYAAIASALVFHHHKITAHAYAHLHEGLSTLGSKAWVPDAMKDLFAKAREICRNRLPAGETETD